VPIDSPYPAEAAILSLQGEDSVSSNAQPAAAGVSVLGDVVDGTGVGDVASGMGGVEVPLPADSDESTSHDNPLSPGWMKR
jgi:hypothetical protein